MSPSRFAPGGILALALALLLPSAQDAAAQTVPVDQGTFRIMSNGTEVGTEEFAIRRSGTGAGLQVIATAEIQLRVPEGNTSMVPLLQASGGDMAVSGYQLKVSGATQEEVTIELGPGRYLSRVRSERGEREREYRAASGTILLDPGVAHQYYFVAVRLENGEATIPVISPREGRQFELRVTTVSASTNVALVEGSTQGRHLRLEGDGRVRELWVGPDGQVLRVEDPDRGFTAIRRRAP
jgi:hypothetical protein